jgi:hypothetical protein
VARQRGGRLDDMLAVIEDHHLVPVRERGGQPFQRTDPDSGVRRAIMGSRAPNVSRTA